jgi:hypothetical protein
MTSDVSVVPLTFYSDVPHWAHDGDTIMAGISDISSNFPLTTMPKDLISGIDPRHTDHCPLQLQMRMSLVIQLLPSGKGSSGESASFKVELPVPTRQELFPSGQSR